MKNTFIIIVAIVIVASGCMSTKNTNSYKNIELKSAKYTEWNESSPAQSDIRERGFDLEVTFSEWPGDAQPAYIIFRNWQSFPAGITWKSTGEAIITATVIARSAILENRSLKSALTDRLVFTDSQGGFDFIEIFNWKRKKN